jgi:predicted flap endonuclease-1-like 5' DNA nuclease
MENLNIWCWIVPAVVGLVCALFGYLIGKGKNSQIDQTAELNLLKDKNAKLETHLAACNKQLTQKVELVVPVEAVAPTTGTEVLLPFNAQAAKSVFGKTIKQNDLKIVEGIGPKIQQLFNSFDIKTWKDLSETAVAKCQEILDSGGARYQIHDPASWPMQAKMAYEGKWKELHKWQEEHKRGKL